MRLPNQPGITLVRLLWVPQQQLLEPLEQLLVLGMQLVSLHHLQALVLGLLLFSWMELVLVLELLAWEELPELVELLILLQFISYHQFLALLLLPAPYQCFQQPYSPH